MKNTEIMLYMFLFYYKRKIYFSIFYNYHKSILRFLKMNDSINAYKFKNKSKGSPGSADVLRLRKKNDN